VRTLQDKKTGKSTEAPSHPQQSYNQPLAYISWYISIITSAAAFSCAISHPSLTDDLMQKLRKSHLILPDIKHRNYTLQNRDPDHILEIIKQFDLVELPIAEIQTSSPV
jgi:hypothetical protein